MPAHQGSAVARLNTVLASVCDADATLYFIISSAFPDVYQFGIPPFRLGRLRSDKIKYRSNKAGSDFYERYRDELRDAWAVEREPKTVRVLDLMSFRYRIFDGPAFGREREPLRTQTNIYKPGVALRGDFIIEVADREFVFTGFDWRGKLKVVSPFVYRLLRRGAHLSHWPQGGGAGKSYNSAKCPRRQSLDLKNLRKASILTLLSSMSC